MFDEIGIDLNQAVCIYKSWFRFLLTFFFLFNSWEILLLQLQAQQIKNNVLLKPLEAMMETTFKQDWTVYEDDYFFLYQIYTKFKYTFGLPSI